MEADRHVQRRRLQFQLNPQAAALRVRQDLQPQPRAEYTKAIEELALWVQTSHGLSKSEQELLAACSTNKGSTVLFNIFGGVLIYNLLGVKQSRYRFWHNSRTMKLYRPFVAIGWTVFGSVLGNSMDARTNVATVLTHESPLGAEARRLFLRNAPGTSLARLAAAFTRETHLESDSDSSVDHHVGTPTSSYSHSRLRRDLTGMQESTHDMLGDFEHEPTTTTTSSLPLTLTTTPAPDRKRGYDEWERREREIQRERELELERERREMERERELERSRRQFNAGTTFTGQSPARSAREESIERKRKLREERLAREARGEGTEPLLGDVETTMVTARRI